MLWAMLALGVACAAAYGLKTLESRVAPAPAAKAPIAVRIRLPAIPQWMPMSLASQVARSVLPRGADFGDPGLVEAVYARAVACPWVRSVSRVQKAHTDDPLVGLVEVEAEFRQPAATVLLKDGSCALVDVEGARLPDDPRSPGAPRWVVALPNPGGPERQVCYWDRSEIPAGAAARAVHYIAVEGVQAAPPPPGQRWQGQDIADAIRVLKLLHARRYANQISSIDVRNHSGRVWANSRMPHITIYAQGRDGQRVEIRFDRFPHPDGDYIVSPQTRMANLDDYVARCGGSFGQHRRIDLRYEQIHVE